MAVGKLPVAAVTVTYNSASLLPGLLDGLDGLEQVIVVDNASDDASVAVARSHSVVSDVVELPENRGYGAGVNAGVARCRADHVLVLNPDIRIGRAAVERLLEALDDQGAGVAAPVLLNPDGSVQRSVRRFPSIWELLGRMLRRDNRRGQPHDGGPVDWALGAAWLVRRETFESLEGFDEGFFLYFEDVDFCRRARESGLVTLLVASAHAEHLYARSSEGKWRIWQPVVRMHWRSAARYFRKWPLDAVAGGRRVGSPVARQRALRGS